MAEIYISGNPINPENPLSVQVERPVSISQTAGENGVVASQPTSVADETLQVNAASVDAGAWSVIASTPTGGKRWALVRVLCNKAHTVEFYAGAAAFVAIANAAKLRSYTTSGLADNTTTTGDLYLVPCPAKGHFAARLQNNDGAAAATVSIGVRFFD